MDEEIRYWSRRTGPEATARRESLELESKQLTNQLYFETCSVKKKPVQAYLTSLLKEGRKFLVFAHHESMLDACQATCRQTDPPVPHIRIDGSTPTADRAKLVDQFQEQEDVRVAVLSINAANAGITLTASYTVVFA